MVTRPNGSAGRAMEFAAIVIGAHFFKNKSNIFITHKNPIIIINNFFKKGERRCKHLSHSSSLPLRSNEDDVRGFLAMDNRQALHYLGEITGEITTEDLLDNIFSKFCIGK